MLQRYVVGGRAVAPGIYQPLCKTGVVADDSKSLTPVTRTQSALCHVHVLRNGGYRIYR